MYLRSLLSIVGVLCVTASVYSAEEPKKTLFGNAVKALSDRYVVEEFRENELPRMVELYRERAENAKSFEEERDVLQQFLSNIPSTHLGMIQKDTRDHMMSELSGKSSPTFGFELIEYDGKHYAFNVLEGGPADVGGLRRGDRIVTLDGKLVDESARLSWRTDDAFLPDPPVRGLHGAEGDTIQLRIERTPGVYSDVEIKNQSYSAWEATKNSARVIEQDGKRIGYIHYWLIQLAGPDVLLREKLEGEFASCDALVWDLRGRGGSGFMVKRLLDLLDGDTAIWDKPIVALINQHSRSAKDVIAYEIRDRALGTLVGERTAGAVIPVSFADIGFDTLLMFPTFTLGQHTENLEFNGVEPDVSVAEVGPYSAGADPIFDAGVREAARLAGAAPASSTGKQAASGKTPSTERVVSAKSNTPHRRRLAANPGRGRIEVASGKLAPLSKDDKPGHDAKALDLLAKVVDALGGESTLRRHEHITTQGIFDVSGMIEGPYTSFQSAPNQVLMRIDLAGMGRVESGYNGKVGWEINPQSGDAPTSEEDLPDAIIDADHFAAINYEKNHRSIRYIGQTVLDGKDCHEIRLTRHTGKVEVRYVEVGTYLPVGRRSMADSRMGEMTATQTVKEFKTFDGETIPIHYVQDIGGMQEQTFKVSDISFEAIDESAFAIPEAIATILKH